MPRPTGQQWVRLYRGLHESTPETVSTKQIGPHWTPDFNIAYNFATYRNTEGYPLHDASDDDIPLAGTVVEALVHRRHIIDPESEEGRGWQEGEAVFGSWHPEQERTVRPGATVHVQSLHHFDDDKGTYKEVKVPQGLKARGRA
jgi:hypothetical protein